MPPRFRRGFAALVAVPAILVAGCSKEPGTAPRIVSLTVVSGLGQTSFVGALLPAPLVVRASDQNGAPATDVLVTWTVASGGGTVSPSQTVTDANGVAATTFRLGATLGQQAVRATMPGGQPVTFTATATAAPASQITVVSGNAQTAVVRTALPAPLTVRVADAFGNVKEGITVFFTVLQGNGTLSSPSAVTGASGQASVTWTLGPAAGGQRVSATIPGVAPAIFDATGTPAAPALVVVVSGNNQSAPPGAPLPDSLVVRVTDQYENPVKDVNVAWSTVGNGGTVSPLGGKTDPMGRASTAWTLGPTGGPKEARATVQGLAPATFQAAGTIIFASVMAGGRHSCAIDEGGVAYCWGFNDSGQLGIGSVTPGSGPVFANLFPNAVTGGRTFSVGKGTAGAAHSCAIDLNNIPWCWGLNVDGRTGIGSNGAPVTAPDDIAGTNLYRTVSAGASHTCGITTSDRLFCWGSTDQGKLGVGPAAQSFFSTPQAVAPAIAFGAVSSGGLHTCAVTTAGSLYCWGSNARGQAGLGATAGVNVPTQLPGNGYSALVTGLNHSCAVTSNILRCWGANESGQLGDGSTTDRTTPVNAATGFPPFVQLAAGDAHTCGRTAAGIVYCWGLGTSGQLGTSAFASSPNPLPVAGGHTFASISAGGNQTCGVTTGRVVYCWGDNQYGALGNGTQTNAAVPVKVAFQP